ncbi:piggyBac transposable element-derived protein 4 isoform X1 [Penaeus vannamei]|uniref:piggyBac transposable element-derived protein 4 isoform X1 n=1 Tax=Penaeus vannamei TaxID=6689 RepID=UPI00387F6D75
MAGECSVAGCKGRDNLLTFPEEETEKRVWRDFCKSETVNFETARICGKHFKDTDYESVTSRKLKTGSLPTQHPSGIKSKPAREGCSTEEFQRQMKRLKKERGILLKRNRLLTKEIKEAMKQVSDLRYQNELITKERDKAQKERDALQLEKIHLLSALEEERKAREVLVARKRKEEAELNKTVTESNRVPDCPLTETPTVDIINVKEENEMSLTEVHNVEMKDIGSEDADMEPKTEEDITIKEEEIECGDPLLTFPCQFCEIVYATQSDLENHIKEEHEKGEMLTCCSCYKMFSDGIALKLHRVVHHQAKLSKKEEEELAALHSDVSDDRFRKISEANTAGRSTTHMPWKLRSSSSGDKPSAVRKHDDPTSTSQEAGDSTSSPGGAPSSRSYSSGPGSSTTRQAGTAGLRRGCQTQSFLDLLDESDFSESDDDWLPEAVTSAGRLIGVEEAVTSSDSDSEEDLQETSVSSAGEPRRLFYLRNKSFVDHAPQNATENLGSCNVLKPIEYFLSYVSEDFLEDIAMYTNMKSTETTGTCINTNSKEIAAFIGMTFAMSIIKMPRIRMYWQSKTRIPWIADKMTRDRFFRLRHSLKVIDDNTVLEDERKVDRLWKVRPLLEAVRTRCSKLPRPPKVSIDESMIPFRGRISIRHVPGKPFPDGLKMFVLASPSGMILDFEIFQTKKALLSIVENLNVKPNRTITTGEAAVLRFVRSVDAGTSIFFDRYFTSSNLLCDLYDRGLRGTGIIKNNMVPKEAKQKLKTEVALRKEGRGASDCQVRNDNKVAVTAWYDKKLVLMASNEFSIDDEDICQRWSKVTNARVDVKRPRVVREYNRAMGGVDLHDQLVSYYRSPNRTKKWTVRVVLHLLDAVTVNCWLEYRKDMESKSKQYLDFKLILADQLMSGDFLDHATDSQSISDASPVSVDFTDSETEPPPKAAKQGLTPLPNRAERKKGASHLPIIIDDKNSFRRCRREGCKNRTRTFCSRCKVFLCNYAKRNCFYEFHV